MSGQEYHSRHSGMHMPKKKIRQKAIHAESKCTLNSQIKLYGHFQHTVEESTKQSLELILLIVINNFLKSIIVSIPEWMTV